MSCDSSFTPCKGIQARVKELYDELGNWTLVGDKLGVSPAMAWRVANQGYEPKDAEIRKKLGFPEIIQVKVHRNKEGRFSKE